VIITALLVLFAQAVVNSLADKSGAAEMLSLIETVLEIILTVCDSFGWKKVARTEVSKTVAPIIEVRTRNFWKSLQWLA
jgi:hypothetical protein